MEKGTIVHIKNLTDGTQIKIDSKEELHIIGFGQDGTVQTAPLSSTDRFTDLPSEIVVPLLILTKCHHGGLMLSSYNKDITCFVNKEMLASEINLIGGSIIEVADNKLKIIIGPITKERRLLPQTPGISVSKTPPRKPNRAGENLAVDIDIGTDWYHVQHPPLDHELLEQMTCPKQIGNLAASFLTKQVNVYTDSKLCTKMTDQIFKFLQEVVEYQKHIIMGYLKEVTSYIDEMPESERDKPMHAPAIKLIVELLRQILDPLSHVVLCLQLLRKFSHFPKNLPIIIKCQAAAAVMGCMAVYLNEEEVQLNCLDILAKIATYQYQLTEKVQIRETGLEMVLRALKHHELHEDILQAGCRTLSNLTASLQTTLDSWLDIAYNSDADVEEGIIKYEGLLNHIFTQATPTVQKILEEFTDNLGIRTEGRRFLYNLSKMTQLLSRKCRRTLVEVDDNNIEEDCTKHESENLVKPTVLTPTKKPEVETKSILHHQGEKFPGVSRKVQFVDDFLDSVTSVSSSENDSEGEDNDDFVKQKETGGAVIEITETRKLTKTEIENIKIKDDFELLSSFESQAEAELCEESENDETIISEDNESECSGDSQCVVEDVKNMDNTRENSVSIEPALSANVNPEHLGNDVDILENQETEEITNSDHHSKCSDNLVSHTDNVVDTVHDVNEKLESPGRLSVGDIEILSSVVRTKVAQHVSCLVMTGNDSQALKDIDEPVLSLLEKAEAPYGLVEFVKQQYDQSKTLLDVDPAFLISVVDAVRYSSLLPDLLRKSLLDVITGLHTNMNTFVIHVAAFCIKSALTNEALLPIVTEKTFTETMKTSLQSIVQKSTHLADMVELLG